MNKLGATRNPFTLIGAMAAVGDHVAVDEGLGLLEAAQLGLTLAAPNPSQQRFRPTASSRRPGPMCLSLTRERRSAGAVQRLRFLASNLPRALPSPDGDHDTVPTR